MASDEPSNDPTAGGLANDGEQKSPVDISSSAKGNPPPSSKSAVADGEQAGDGGKKKMKKLNRRSRLDGSRPASRASATPVVDESDHAGASGSAGGQKPESPPPSRRQSDVPVLGDDSKQPRPSISAEGQKPDSRPATRGSAAGAVVEDDNQGGPLLLTGRAPSRSLSPFKGTGKREGDPKKTDKVKHDPSPGPIPFMLGSSASISTGTDAPASRQGSLDAGVSAAIDATFPDAEVHASPVVVDAPAATNGRESRQRGQEVPRAPGSVRPTRTEGRATTASTSRPRAVSYAETNQSSHGNQEAQDFRSWRRCLAWFRRNILANFLVLPGERSWPAVPATWLPFVVFVPVMLVWLMQEQGIRVAQSNIDLTKYRRMAVSDEWLSERKQRFVYGPSKSVYTVYTHTIALPGLTPATTRVMNTELYGAQTAPSVETVYFTETKTEQADNATAQGVVPAVPAPEVNSIHQNLQTVANRSAELILVNMHLKNLPYALHDATTDVYRIYRDFTTTARSPIAAADARTWLKMFISTEKGLHKLLAPFVADVANYGKRVLTSEREVLASIDGVDLDVAERFFSSANYRNTERGLCRLSMFFCSLPSPAERRRLLGRTFVNPVLRKAQALIDTAERIAVGLADVAILVEQVIIEGSGDLSETYSVNVSGRQHISSYGDFVTANLRLLRELPSVETRRDQLEVIYVIANDAKLQIELVLHELQNVHAALEGIAGSLEADKYGLELSEHLVSSELREYVGETWDNTVIRQTAALLGLTKPQ